MQNNLTKRGIAYNLKLSPYKVQLEYVASSRDVNSITFVFSSEFYRQKFSEELQNNRAKIQESLSKRFGYEVKQEMLCDIVLYSKIEKRGFLIFYNNEVVECQEYITLDGKNLIIKN